MFCGPLEGVVELLSIPSTSHGAPLGEEEEGGTRLGVKVRGPSGTRKLCFYFLEELLGIIDQVLLEMSPGLAIDKHILSSKDLESYASPHSWTPAQVMKVLEVEGWRGTLEHPEGWTETLNSLLCWDCQEVQDILLKGCSLHVSSISTVTRQTLCHLLDKPHPLGRDWCLLAVQLGLSDKVPKLDVGSGSYSQTARLLDEWALSPSSLVSGLLEHLDTLGRQDAVNALLSGSSLYRISPHDPETSDVQLNYSGGSNISR